MKLIFSRVECRSCWRGVPSCGIIMETPVVQHGSQNREHSLAFWDRFLLSYRQWKAVHMACVLERKQKVAVPRNIHYLCLLALLTSWFLTQLYSRFDDTRKLCRYYILFHWSLTLHVITSNAPVSSAILVHTHIFVLTFPWWKLTFTAQWLHYVSPGIILRNSVLCTLSVCVLCGSENKYQLFLYVASTPWFL